MMHRKPAARSLRGESLVSGSRYCVADPDVGTTGRARNRLSLREWRLFGCEGGRQANSSFKEPSFFSFWHSHTKPSPD